MTVGRDPAAQVGTLAPMRPALASRRRQLSTSDDPGRRGEVPFTGEIPSRPESVAKMHERLAAKYSLSATKRGLAARAALAGHHAGEQRRGDCVVVAPSLVPTRPGDHVKTDRRVATKLAALFRSGELMPIWVPDDAHEAMRDLCRASQAAMQGLQRGASRF